MCVKVIFNFCVREWLDINFRDNWIGRRGSFESHFKDMVYTEKPRTIPDIRRVIADKIAIIDTELCQKVCHSVAARLVSCIEHNREQFEQSE